MLFFTKGENHRPKGMKTRIWAHKKSAPQRAMHFLSYYKGYITLQPSQDA